MYAPQKNDDQIKAELERPDKGGQFGQVIAIIGGITGGSAVALPLATIAGANTIPVLTTAASFFGVSVLSTTPIGWILGAALAGSMVSCSIVKLIRSGGESDLIRKEIVSRLSKRLIDKKLPPLSILDANKIFSVIDKAVADKKIDHEMAGKLKNLILQGRLNHELAIERINSLYNQVK